MAHADDDFDLDLKGIYIERIRLECDDLFSFLAVLDAGLAGQLNGALEFLQGIEDEEIADQVGGDIEDLQGRFPHLLWQSAFIAIYSLFEQSMNDLCVRIREHAQQQQIAGQAPANLPGAALPAQNCLRRFIRRLPVRSREWIRFPAYVPIRNAIAHNHGRLRQDDQGDAVRQFARHHAHIQVDGNQVILNRQFCEQVIDDMRSILSSAVRLTPNALFDP